LPRGEEGGQNDSPSSALLVLLLLRPVADPTPVMEGIVRNRILPGSYDDRLFEPQPYSRSLWSFFGLLVPMGQDFYFFRSPCIKQRAAQ